MNEGTVHRQELLTENEVESIITAFKNSYVESRGKLPTPAQEACLLLRHDLAFAGSHSDRIFTTSEPDRARLIDLVEISSNNLKNIAVGRSWLSEEPSFIT
jgi:hypothetical protein